MIGLIFGDIGGGGIGVEESLSFDRSMFLLKRKCSNNAFKGSNKNGNDETALVKAEYLIPPDASSGSKAAIIHSASFSSSLSFDSDKSSPYFAKFSCGLRGAKTSNKMRNRLKFSTGICARCIFFSRATF